MALNNCRSGLVAVGIFSAVMNILMLTGPFFMLQVYDRVLTSRSLSTLIALSLLALALYLFYGAFDLIRSRLLARLGRTLDRDVAPLAFARSVVGARPEYQGAAKDLKQVQQFVASPAIATLFDVPWFPFYLTIIFALHPLIGALSLVGAVLLVGIAVLTELIVRPREARIASAANDEDRLLVSYRRQSETITALGMIDNLTRIWNERHQNRLDQQGATGDLQSFFATASRTLRLILQSAILGYGAYLVIANQLSPGALIASSIIFARALAPLDQSIAHWRTITNARNAYDRLCLALAGSTASADRMRLELPKKSLTVTDLVVTTPDGTAPLLSGATLSLHAGDGLGVIGPTGSGKSTLIRGLLGQLPTSKGDVRLDGATLDQWSDGRRGHIIGYLSQDIEMLPGTIGQNISRFSPDATSEKILKAAEIAGIHDLVVGKPEGYDTRVGAGGIILSGGERQRLALARAVYGDPFLVVLDEPNSNMDVNGEKSLSRVIKALRARGAIVVVVTHRSAVLGQLNKVVQIMSGRLTAFGDTATVTQRLREQHKQAARSLRVVKKSE